jgi:hypothetical protein
MQGEPRFEFRTCRTCRVLRGLQQCPTDANRSKFSPLFVEASNVVTISANWAA